MRRGWSGEQRQGRMAEPTVETEAPRIQAETDERGVLPPPEGGRRSSSGYSSSSTRSCCGMSPTSSTSGTSAPQNDEYTGTNCRPRYFIAKVIDVIGQNSYPQPETDKLKMVAGIEEYLRIEFEQSKYHMKDVVVGLIKHKALNIVRRETTGLAGDVQQTDNETLTKFEIPTYESVLSQCNTFHPDALSSSRFHLADRRRGARLRHG